MRRTWRRAVALTMAAALLGGCGVAAHTGVTRDGDGPRGQSDPGAQPQGKNVPQRQDATDPTQLVENFLMVAVPDAKESMSRQRDYLDPSNSGAWHPDPQVTVVRLIGDFRTPRNAVPTGPVTVTLQPVGTLTELGAVEPPGNRQVINYTFDVRKFTAAGPGEGPSKTGLYLADAPPQILLLDTALSRGERLYLPYPIYFWDNDDNTLVPDLRYLSLSIPEQQRYTEVLRWLLAGPSTMLKRTAQGLPTGIELLGGNVYQEDGRLMVNLGNKAAGVDSRLLMTQLRWSLWRLYNGRIGLLIQGQRVPIDDSPAAYRLANATVGLPDDPDAMCIAGGKVISRCDESGGPEVGAVAGPNNTDVVSAAISTDPRGRTRSALVKPDGKNRWALWAGQQTNAGPTLARAGLAGTAMSRPVWLRVWGENPPSQTGLVAVDGALWRFVTATGVAVDPLAVPVESGDQLLGGITAVAAAPDARRIALLAGGRLYVAPLLVTKGTVTVGAARPLFTTLRNLEGVAFNSENGLLIAGHDGGANWIAEITIDGAIETRYVRDIGGVSIRQLVAYPDNAYNGQARGLVMIELDGQAYRVYNTTAANLQFIDGDSPPASAGTGPARTKTAPFYVD